MPSSHWHVQTFRRLKRDHGSPDEDGSSARKSMSPRERGGGVLTTSELTNASAEAAGKGKRRGQPQKALAALEASESIDVADDPLWRSNVDVTSIFFRRKKAALDRRNKVVLAPSPSYLPYREPALMSHCGGSMTRPASFARQIDLEWYLTVFQLPVHFSAARSP